MTGTPTDLSAKPRGEAAERILAAAEKLFASRGFAAVSVRDIAAEAGVNKALVFYYFDNKANLLQSVLEQYYEAHRAVLAPVDEKLGVRQNMQRLVDAYLDFIEANHRYLQIVQHELACNNENLPMIRIGLRSLYERVRELLGDLTSEGALHARQFYISFSGLVITYFNYAPVLDALWDGDPLSESNRQERREHLHWMMTQILNGLGVPQDG